MGFLNSRDKGMEGVNFVKTLLDKAKIKYEEKIGNHPEFDLIITLNKTIIYVEVKFDIYQSKTGNLAIEYYNPKTQKKSGISETKAQLWIYVLQGGFCWVSNTKSIKKYIKRNKAKKDIKYGGDRNASLYLYDSVEILTSIFKRIDNCSARVLKSIIKKLYQDK